MWVEATPGCGVCPSVCVNPLPFSPPRSNISSVVERQWRQQLTDVENDAVEDTVLRDLWVKHLDALYTATRVYSPSGDWPEVT
jgi:hypothetical protein